MNPLDKEEFAAFTEIMHKEMPLHTPTNTRIPKSQYSAFPKKLMEYSAKIDNKFLNNYQHFIEEMESRRKLSTLSFKNYQVNYYDKYGILSKDGFYSTAKKILTSKHRGVWGNMPTGFIAFGRVNGSVIETNDGSTGDDGVHFSTGFLYTQKLPNTGVVGQFYDQVANDTKSAAGNKHLGVYNDNGSSVPSALKADTGSYAQANDYNFHSVTEFSVSNTQMWTAVTVSLLSGTTYLSGQPANSERFGTLTYGNLPDPATTDQGGTTSVPRLKIGHS